MEGANQRDGEVLEELGHYDPVNKDPDKQLDVKKERVEYWLSVGARPSDTVRNLLEKSGITVGK